MTGDDNHDGDQPETSNPSQPIPPPTSQLPHTILSIKLPILKKGEYDIWVIKMKHYLCHTNYPIWQVIQNGNGHVSVTTDTNGMIKVLPPKTAEEEAIKSRFGGNDEFKKMQKYLLKQQFEGFSVSSSKGLHKGYGRFQTLLSQLKIHGIGVSHEDANQKFLRSLPSSWSQVALIMRTKPSTNDVSTAYSVSSPYVSKLQKERSASYTDEVIHFFFANQSSAPQLDCDDLEQIIDDDLEEIDLKWQVAMISMRIKKFHKRTSRKLQRRECGYNGNKARDNSRRPAHQDDSKALVTLDGEDIDWSGHVEEDTQNFAIMAYSSSNLGSDNKTAEYQMSANDKCGLGYGDYRYGSILSYENEVLQSVFMNKECDLENSPVNDRYVEGMHAVPPPMTGNYMPSGSDVEIDYSKFTYLENAPKVVSEPKVWTDSPIIKEYESDSDDDLVSNVSEEKEKPSFAFTDTAKQVKTFRENVKETSTPNHYPKIEKQIDIVTLEKDDPHKALKDKGIVDSGCSRHMTVNKAQLADYQEFKGGSVAFGGSNRRITGKEKIKAGRQHNMYSFNLKNIDLSGDLSCLLAKASIDESNKWHRRLGHVNFKNLNKLVKGNLVRGLPSKIFEDDHTCVACQKGKQHKASWIKREYNNARTPQQNGVAERKNMTLIEAAKTMLADSFLPITFWAEAVNTAYYVLNREELEKLKRQENEANDALRNEATHDSTDANINSTNLLIVVSAPISVVGPSRALNADEPSYPDDPSMPHLEDIFASPSEGIFTNSSYDDEGVVTDFNNLETTVNVSPTPTTRIHTIHPKTQILGDPMSAVQTRSKVHKNSKAYALEEGIDYDEVFAPVARIEAIRIFLAFASYMGFIVYQIDVKSAFLYGTIDEEVYVTQPPGFVDPKFSNKVYKVVKALYGLHKAPRACVKTASTSIETQKPLVKNEEASDVDVTPKTSHLQAVKRIFRYLKGQPKLGLWYPKVSSFDLEAYSDSDYAGANLDRKSTTGGS
uniref:Ribonuclease H-like domain-containing protein n=1 Tax=Tanacetum cinerariifolium TaxID=118510 RepID=A0A6L2JZ38_TANCI|nr:ribonuclease H-like domain-containing protein [Tanacetum cinerariifolium]